VTSIACISISENIYTPKCFCKEQGAGEKLFEIWLDRLLFLAGGFEVLMADYFFSNWSFG
jgi:hypothetical protein